MFKKLMLILRHTEIDCEPHVETSVLSHNQWKTNFLIKEN